MDYRKRALKILPWVCTRCAREFTGKNLRQLTVHHKDHDHTNNPPDGSNWELLCIYCHDDEHSRNETAAAYGKPSTGRRSERGSFKAFEGLGGMLGVAAAPEPDEVEDAVDDAASDDAAEDAAPDAADDVTRQLAEGDDAATSATTEPGAASDDGSTAGSAAPSKRDFWGDDDDH